MKKEAIPAAKRRKAAHGELLSCFAYETLGDPRNEFAAQTLHGNYCECHHSGT